MLRDKMEKYFIEQDKNCAQAMIYAANEEYGLGLGEREMDLLKGFGGGMGCGSTCGALAGSIAVLGHMFCQDKTREEAHAICGSYVDAFTRRFSSSLCAELTPVYKKEGTRCLGLLQENADLLDETVRRLSGKDGKLTAADIKRVKALGCLQDKRYADIFNVRVITRNGKITSAEQKAVAEAAEKFGSGEVTMTSRLTLEIQGVPYAKIDDVRAFLAQHGLETGGTGSKVRPVVSCKGTTCQYGLIDTFALSGKLHELFYKGYREVSLPHKFKLAVGGCPNNCVKPDLNDLGIIGQRVPRIDPDKCRGCKKCQVESACPLHIARLEDGKITIDPNACNHCGRCVGKCPFDALDAEMTGYRIYLGGRWGKRVAQGRPMDPVFTSEEEVLAIVERAILLFRAEGISGERFADTVARLGFDEVQRKLLSDELDKDAILKKDVKGGASC